MVTAILHRGTMGKPKIDNTLRLSSQQCQCWPYDEEIRLVVAGQRKTESHRHDVCQNVAATLSAQNTAGRAGLVYRGYPRTHHVSPIHRWRQHLESGPPQLRLLNFFEISPLGTAGRSCSLPHNCRMTGVLGRWKLTQILKRCAPQGTGKWGISTMSLPCTQRC